MTAQEGQQQQPVQWQYKDINMWQPHLADRELRHGGKGKRKQKQKENGIQSRWEDKQHKSGQVT